MAYFAITSRGMHGCLAGFRRPLDRWIDTKIGIPAKVEAMRRSIRTEGRIGSANLRASNPTMTRTKVAKAVGVPVPVRGTQSMTHPFQSFWRTQSPIKL